MNKCKHCGCPNEDNTVYCIYCGDRVDGQEDNVNIDLRPAKKESKVENTPKRPAPVKKPTTGARPASRPSAASNAGYVLGKFFLVLTSIIVFILLIFVFVNAFSNKVGEMIGCIIGIGIALGVGTAICKLCDHIANNY